MSKYTSLNELDVIFISYNEPLAEQGWAKLLTIVPWAQRVHGVKGFHQAHMKAASISSTERFITVDGDNEVDASFFDQQINFDDPKYAGKILSWKARNSINGLEYGNGGLKIWTKEVFKTMKSHEEAPSGNKAAAIEFCWEDNYEQIDQSFSTTVVNGSPQQAFQAGFREGVKMSLDRGNKVNPKQFESSIWWGNYNRLLIWCSVGAHVDNGIWSNYGTRLGAKMTALTDWDYVNVRDFDQLNDIWETESSKFVGTDSKCYASGYSWDVKKLDDAIVQLGTDLRKGIGLEIAELDDKQSLFFKKAYINPPRMG